MCTCIKWKWDKYQFFGRTLDSTQEYAQKVVITPRNYRFSFIHATIKDCNYAIIGMATMYKDAPLYAEATNEKGLSIAALEFPGNSRYYPYYPSKINIAPFEVIPFILRQCASIDDVKKLMKDIHLVDQGLDEIIVTVPLHWMISDKNRTLVIESTDDGIKLYDDAFNVLTNNPPFYYHKENIANYLNLTAEYPENRFSKNLKLTPFSNGIGSFGLPGDYSSASRFVKASFLISNTEAITSYDEAVAEFFHVLDAVSPIKGAVISANAKTSFTIYTSCIDLESHTYYFKTYWDNTIRRAELYRADLNSKKPIVYEVDFKKSQFQDIN